MTVRLSPLRRGRRTAAPRTALVLTMAVVSAALTTLVPSSNARMRAVALPFQVVDAAPAAAMPSRPDAPAIVGGREAKPGDWPWMVAVMDANARNQVDAQFCGGALIDPGWAVTAGHCMTQLLGQAELPLYAHDVVVGLGIHDLKTDQPQVVPVAQIFINDDYFNFDTEDWGDIALLRLARPAQLGAGVQTIPLVAGIADPAIAPSQPATVIGWGETEIGPTNRLHQVAVPISPPTACGLNDSIICAGEEGRDACYGDSGGPLMVPGAGGAGWRLAGVTSSGTTEVCAGPGNFTMYTSLAYYADWINGVMRDTGPALEVEKLAPPTVGRGETIDYALVVRNVGRGAATNIAVRDSLPLGVTFVSADNGGRRMGNIVSWQVASIAGETAVQLGLTVRDTPSLASAPSLAHLGLPFAPPARHPAARVDRARRAMAERRLAPRPDDPATARGGPAAIDPPPARHSTDTTTADLVSGDIGRGDPVGGASIGGDIVGGRPAAPGAWPALAAVVDRSIPNPRDAAFCGGALVAPSWVLTAAHCLVDPFTGNIYDPSKLEVKLGSNVLSDAQGQRIGVQEVFMNLRYNFDDEADLGLLQLARPATLTDRVKPIDLATAADSPLWAAGRIGSVAGWGDTTGNEDYPDDLREVDLPVADPGVCGQFADPDKTLCAGPETGGKSACYGDSGGPFVVKRADGTAVLAGVVSRGSGDFCGEPGAYSLFVHAASFTSWVADKTGPDGRPDELIVNHDYTVRADGLPARPGLPAFTVVTGPITVPTVTPAATTATPTATPVPSATPDDSPPTIWLPWVGGGTHF